MNITNFRSSIKSLACKNGLFYRQSFLSIGNNPVALPKFGNISDNKNVNSLILGILALFTLLGSGFVGRTIYLKVKNIKKEAENLKITRHN